MEKEEAIQELQKESLQSLSDRDLLFLIESYVTSGMITRILQV
jgi:hypothetical protein